MIFAEDGAVSWEVIGDPALTRDPTSPRSTRSTGCSRKPYYGALAVAPDAGLASEITALAAN